MNLTVVTPNRGLVWSSIVVLLQNLIGSLLVDGELVYVNNSSVSSLLLNDGEYVSVKVLLLDSEHIRMALTEIAG